jgi:hypothetical protein
LVYPFVYAVSAITRDLEIDLRLKYLQVKLTFA